MSIKIFFFLVEVMSRDSPEGSMSYLKDFGKQFQHKIIFQERFSQMKYISQQQQQVRIRYNVVSFANTLKATGSRRGVREGELGLQLSVAATQMIRG